MPEKVWPLTMVWVEPCGFSLAAWFQVCSWVPGERSTNFVKFRSSTGSSVICLVSKMVATSARSVFRSWPAVASTVTVSVRSPVSRRSASWVWVSTLTITFGTNWALKPVSSAFTS